MHPSQKHNDLLFSHYVILLSYHTQLTIRSDVIKCSLDNMELDIQNNLENGSFKEKCTGTEACSTMRAPGVLSSAFSLNASA